MTTFMQIFYAIVLTVFNIYGLTGIMYYCYTTYKERHGKKLWYVDDKIVKTIGRFYLK